MKHPKKETGFPRLDASCIGPRVPPSDADVLLFRLIGARLHEITLRHLELLSNGEVSVDPLVLDRFVGRLVGELLPDVGEMLVAVAWAGWDAGTENRSAGQAVHQALRIVGCVLRDLWGREKAEERARSTSRSHEFPSAIDADDEALPM